MTQFDANHAFDIGYGYAVVGIINVVPAGTWLTNFPADFREGYEQAIADGKWGSHPDYK